MKQLLHSPLPFNSKLNTDIIKRAVIINTINVIITFKIKIVDKNAKNSIFSPLLLFFINLINFLNLNSAKIIIIIVVVISQVYSYLYDNK